jgi:transposase
VDSGKLSKRSKKMPRTRTPYPEEFRQQILALVRAGRTPAELAKEFEPTAQTIRNWIKPVLGVGVAGFINVLPGVRCAFCWQAVSA